MAALWLGSMPLAHAGLFGPGKFEVVLADSRFDASGGVVLTSRNNRISKKSIVGGTHLDDAGVYVNPTVKKDGQTGQPLELGLVILNKTGYDTAYGSPNSLGIIQEIAFAPNSGNPVVLAVVGADSAWSDTTSFNPVTQSASKDITESGLAPLTLEQYQAIVSAKSVAVRIVGSKRSVTYEAKDLAPSFIPNLKSFLDQAVAK
jgi:hypothetical protein